MSSARESTTASGATPESAAITLNERIVAAGHVLKLTDDGEIDIFVCDSPGHNGPGCSVCGESWCHHCDNPTIGPCDGGSFLREYEARERLRDAAPDLLEALIELRNVGNDMVKRKAARAKADAALAKAGAW